MSTCQLRDTSVFLWNKPTEGFGSTCMKKWKTKQARCGYEILCLAKNKSNLSLTFLDCILLLVLMLQKQWIFFLHTCLQNI